MTNDRIGDRLSSAETAINNLLQDLQDLPSTYNHQRDLKAIGSRMVRALREQHSLAVFLDRELAELRSRLGE